MLLIYFFLINQSLFWYAFTLSYFIIETNTSNFSFFKNKLKNNAEEKQIHLLQKNINLKHKLLEGDILISEPTVFTKNDSKLREKRKIINVINSKTDTYTRWPNKTVCFN